MKIQEAIQLAVENGWEPKDQNFSLEAVSYKVQALNKVKFKERFFLDRNFWIALGKGIGDGKGENGEDSVSVMTYHNINIVEFSWKVRWYRFINHLASGKSPESYFEGLK